MTLFPSFAMEFILTNNDDHYLIRSKITPRLFWTSTFNCFHNNSCFCSPLQETYLYFTPRHTNLMQSNKILNLTSLQKSCRSKNRPDSFLSLRWGTKISVTKVCLCKAKGIIFLGLKFIATPMCDSWVPKNLLQSRSDVLFQLAGWVYGSTGNQNNAFVQI